MMTLMRIVNSEVSHMSSCSNHQMQSAWSRAVDQETLCRPRSVIIPLTPDHLSHLPPSYTLLAPTHVQVTRCSGSCPQAHSSRLSCVPGQVSVSEVEVMLSPVSVSAGVQESVCASVRLEQHDTCECGCRVTARDCTDQQVYTPHLCQCSCDQGTRAQCLERGWSWDSDHCQCMCPGQPYPTCPTGYVFDYKYTCSCIAPHVPGITEEEIVFVVVLLGFITSVLSLCQCYRRKVGLFKHRRFDQLESGSISHVIRSLSIVDSEATKNKTTAVMDTLKTIEEENIELLATNNHNQ